MGSKHFLLLMIQQNLLIGVLKKEVFQNFLKDILFYKFVKSEETVSNKVYKQANILHVDTDKLVCSLETSGLKKNF